MLESVVSMRHANARGACQGNLIAAQKPAGTDQNKSLRLRGTRPQTDAGKLKGCKCVIGIRRVKHDI